MKTLILFSYPLLSTFHSFLLRIQVFIPSAKNQDIVLYCRHFKIMRKDLLIKIGCKFVSNDYLPFAFKLSFNTLFKELERSFIIQSILIDISYKIKNLNSHFVINMCANDMNLGLFLIHKAKN